MTTVKFSKTAERNVEITAAFSKGESKEVLASRFGLTVRTIQRIVAGCVVVASVAAATPAVAATGNIDASVNGVRAGSIQVTGDNNFTGKVYDLNKLDAVDSKADDADFQAVKTQVDAHTVKINTQIIPDVSNAVSAATKASATATAEVKRATAADTQHDKDIADNKAAIATKADASTVTILQGQVANKADKADIQTAVDAEKTRATKAESDLKSEVDTNTKFVTAAIQGLGDAGTALTTEATRATKAEQANADAITKAVTDQKTTDQKQDTAINNKVSMSAYSNDKIRQLSVDSDQDKAIDSKADKADLTAEVTRAKDAEAKLTTDKADKADVTALQNSQAADHTQIQTNKNEINGVNQKTIDNADDIAANKAAQAKVDAAQNTAIQGKADASTVTTLQGVVNSKASQADLTKETNARHADINQMNTRLKDKLDVTTYGIDKGIQKTTDQKQDTLIAGKATQTDLTAEVTRAKAAESKLTADKADKADVTALQGVVNTKASSADLAKETSARHADVNMLNTRLKDKLDVTTYGIDKGIQKTTDTKQTADIATNKADIAKTKSQVNSLAVSTNQKIGQVKTEADQNKTDIASNKSSIDQNTADIKLKADQTSVNTLSAQQNVNTKNIDTVNDKVIKETADRVAADKTLTASVNNKADSSALTKEIADRKAADNNIAVNVNKEGQARIAGDAKLQGEVDTAQNTANQAVNGLKAKVDQSAYTADKASQKAIDGAQDTLIKGKADASTVTSEVTRAKAAEQANTKLIQGKANSADLTAEVTRAKGVEANKVEKSVFTADQARQDTLIADKADKASVQSVHNEAVSAESHAASNTKLINTEDQKLTVVSGQVTSNSSSIRAIGSQQKVQGDFIQKHEAKLNNHEQRLNVLERADHKRNAQVDKNKSDIAENRKQIKAVGNNAAAQASLHFNGNRDSWALSTGTYNGDGAALAAGLQKSISEHAAVSVQFSASDSGDFMAGVGIHGDY